MIENYASLYKDLKIIVPGKKKLQKQVVFAAFLVHHSAFWKYIDQRTDHE
jgi:hypothetical protein